MKKTKRIRRLLIILAAGLTLAALGILVFVSQAKFGRNPQDQNLARISRSANYADGEFRNLVEKPPLLNEDGLIKSIAKFLLADRERSVPEQAVPTVKTDLKALDKEQDLIIWLGHSSYFFQLAGRRLLLDPVFSDHAAPVFFANKAFEGASPYTAEDMPDIDYLLISHDHWDHLDYPTVVALKSKTKAVICPLGVGSHFERWGFARDMIMEGDWGAAFEVEGLGIHVLPAQHFSGRWLARNKTLWAGYALISPAKKIFISGDSGYGPHFSRIGQDFGGFDLAILDSGQYDPQWPYVHMNPEEASQAAGDLGAAALWPAHVGKFSIAYHAWDDPFTRSAAAARAKDYRLLTPRIGERLDLDDREQAFAEWWTSLR